MSQPRIAYVMSRFPHLPETFILREMAELVRQGWDIRLYPLMLQDQAIVHPEAQDWIPEAQTAPWVSPVVLSALGKRVVSTPKDVLRSVGTMLGGYWRKPGELVRAAALLPKAVRLAEMMQRDGITHIHAHYATYPALVAWLIHRLSGIPYSVTVHAHDIYVSQAMLREKLLDARFVVAISEFNRAFVERHAGADVAAKTHVIHCGIRPERYAQASAAVGGRFEIISIGSLQTYKGFPHLIDACGFLRDRGVAFRCRIIGGGEERANLEAQIARLGLQERVELLGPQPEDQVQSLLPTAHCYVQPSIITDSGKMEGIPVSLMEALACGLPVVATAISGIPELVQPERTGSLVLAGDSVALADALAHVAANGTAAQRMAEAGRELVRREFNLETSVGQLAALFKQSHESPQPRLAQNKQPSVQRGQPLAEQPANRIAFLQLGGFSHINRHLVEQLQRHFPDDAIDVFDVLSLRLHQRLGLQLRNLPWIIREYGGDIVRRKKRLLDCRLITSFMFDQISATMRGLVQPERYKFAFQTQSLFDASQPQVPHFVYTDHTVLANLRYAVVDRRRSLYAPRWIERERSIYRNATRVFAASQFAATSMVEDYGCSPEQVVCAYTGVNIAVPDATAPKTYANPEILFVGVEWERKGGPQLLEAFRTVRRQRPDAHLTIIGCSPPIDEPNVRVVGRIAPEELAPYYAGAMIFCLPAWIEPAGIAYSEAALYRLPVVATTSGGIPDRVVDGVTGILITPGDTAALSTALLALLDNPELCRQYGDAGRQRAIDLFLWERVGDVVAHHIAAALPMLTNG